MNRTRIIMLLALLGLIGLPAIVCAQPAGGGGEGPLDEAAVDTLSDFPWYDADTGELKRLDVEPPDDVKNRDSKWLFNPPNLSLPAWLLELLKFAAWAVLFVLILLLAIFLARTFMDLEGGFADRFDANEDLSLSGDVDRVDALPFQLKGPRSDLLAEARRLYDAGRFAEAMIYLYSYQLVQLDKSHVIRLTRGKTNRQYLREIRRRSNLFDLMQRSMITFEDVFFGDHPLDRSGFEACWMRLDEFHHQLEPEQVLA